MAHTMGLHATPNPQRDRLLSDGARPHAAEVSIFSSVQLPAGSRLCFTTANLRGSHATVRRWSALDHFAQIFRHARTRLVAPAG